MRDPRHSFRRLGLVFVLACAAGVIATQEVRSGELAAHVLVTEQRGELAAASITANVLGSANTVLTTTKPTIQIGAENTCAVELMLVKNGANFKRIPANSYRVLDLKTNAVGFAITTWKVYYTGAAPAGCNFELLSIPPV